MDVKFRDLELVDSGDNVVSLHPVLFYRRMKRIFHRLIFVKKAVRPCEPDTSDTSRWHFKFFKMPKSVVAVHGTSVALKVIVKSSSSVIFLNEYRDQKRYVLNSGLHTLLIPTDRFEVGENVLICNGDCEFKSVGHDAFVLPNKGGLRSKLTKINPIEAAGLFLENAIIKTPDTSCFAGSLYTLYDYDNDCYRRPCWLWNDAPVVSAFLQLAKFQTEGAKNSLYLKAAVEIGEVFLRNQILDAESQNFGALVSRYRYYESAKYPYECLLGPNDTAFIVKWALLPLFEATNDQRFLTHSKIAMIWVRSVIKKFDYVPSQYYVRRKEWEPSQFVDSGFIPEGFAALMAHGEHAEKFAYAQMIEMFSGRYINHFKMPNGFYRQDYSPFSELNNDHIFVRGQGWAMEGFIAAYEATQQSWYKDEAVSIARLLANFQRKNGSWPFLLGNGISSRRIQLRSGVCEKGTALIGYLMLRLYKLEPEQAFFKSGCRALEWCEKSIDRGLGDGFGGIASRSQNSGIVGLPYIRVATGYANAFYILGAMLRQEICEQRAGR